MMAPDASPSSVGFARPVLGMAVMNGCYLGSLFGFLTVAGLAGKALSPEDDLATLPVTAYVAAAAATIVPAAAAMQRFGRQAIFVMAGGCGALGGLSLVVAGITSSFWLVLVAGVLIGIMTAVTSYIRFAAMEAAPAGLAERWASLVLGGGLFAAIAGPALAAYVPDIGGVAFSGAAFSMAALAGAGALAAKLTTFFPVLQAASGFHAWRAALRHAFASKSTWIAICGGAGSYGLMTFVMNLTPLAMVYGYGMHMSDVSWVMQSHIVAMFAPFFAIPIVSKWMGPNAMISVGLALILASFVVLSAGGSLPVFAAALVLVGVGWSLGYVGGTSALVRGSRPHLAWPLQAINELTIDVSNLCASFASGWILFAGGMRAVAYVGGAVSGSLLLMIVILGLRMRRADVQA